MSPVPRPSRLVTLAALLGAATAALSLGARPLVAQAGAAADIAMAERSAPARRTADAFIAAAAGGDAGRAEGMISPNMKQRAGKAAVDRVLSKDVLPFFARFQALGNSVTVTETTDAFGSQGFAFYMWLQPRDGGAPKPFVLYVVDEGGQRVVANVVVDHLVAGRHR